MLGGVQSTLLLNQHAIVVGQVWGPRRLLLFNAVAKTWPCLACWEPQVLGRICPVCQLPWQQHSAGTSQVSYLFSVQVSLSSWYFLFSRRGLLGPSCLEKTVSPRRSNKSLANIIQKDQVIFQQVRRKLGRMTLLRVKLNPNGNRAWTIVSRQDILNRIGALSLAKLNFRHSEEHPGGDCVQREAVATVDCSLPLYLGRICHSSLNFPSSLQV